VVSVLGVQTNGANLRGYLGAVVTIALVVSASVIIFHYANQLHQERVIHRELSFVKVGRPLLINITLPGGAVARLEVANYNLTRDLVVCVRRGSNTTVYALFVREHPEFNNYYPYFLEKMEEYMEELDKWVVREDEIDQLIVDVISIGNAYSIYLGRGVSSITISPSREGTLVRVKVFRRLIDTKTYQAVIIGLIGISLITALLAASLAGAIGNIALSSALNWSMLAVIATRLCSLTVGLILLAVPSIAILIEAAIAPKGKKDT